MCKVSVLMSVYNEKEVYLRSAIDSILKQTFPDFEFIIYDDCSSENVKNVLNEYRQTDKRIKIITNEFNKGLTHNLHFGVTIAHGKYIARMDSDDFSHSERLETQVKYLDANPECAVVASRYNFIFKGKVIKAKKLRCDAYGLRTRLLFENSGIAHPSVMMRKSFLEKHCLNYNLEIKKAQDFDLWAKILQKGEIHVLEKYMLDYRIHKEQISLAGKPEQDNFRNRVITSELKNLSAEITDEDLNVHFRLICANGKLNNRAYSEWKKKLAEIISVRPEYDVRYLKRLFARYRLRYLYKKLKGHVQ